MSLVYFSVVLIGITLLSVVSLHGAEGNLLITGLSLITGITLSAGAGLVLELLRPPPPVQAVGDCVYGTYIPTEDKLDPSACTAYRNKLMIWEAVWRIDKGEHAGDWAMTPKGVVDNSVWVPLGELVIQERRRDLFLRRRTP